MRFGDTKHSIAEIELSWTKEASFLIKKVLAWQKD